MKQMFNYLQFFVLYNIELFDTYFSYLPVLYGVL